MLLYHKIHLLSFFYQTVTIQYDADKTNSDKLIKGFTKIGYSARLVEKGEKVKKNEKEVCDNM